jgi:hypothetical protein
MQTAQTGVENPRVNLLIRVTIQNVASNVLSLGIGGEKLLIPFQGEALCSYRRDRCGTST